jgi:hypothetical protein
MEYDDEDFLDSSNPDDPFQIPKEYEHKIKMILYELAVRNFIVTFSPECMSVTDETERNKVKESLLQTMYEENGKYNYYEEIPHDVYSFEKACKVFDENIKRGDDGEYEGISRDLIDVATKITTEIFEQTCLKMVDKGELQLVFDEKINDFAFLPTKPKNVINKSSKPRRNKK